MPQNSDDLAALTDELLKLEEEFGSEMEVLQDRQEAALKRLRAAIDGVKAEKLSDRIKRSAD